MAQSLAKRFEGKKQEVIGYAKTFGVFSACDKYDCGYIPMQKFLEAETGDPNCGINAPITHSDSQITATTLLDAFLQKVAALEADKLKLQTELSELRKEVKLRQCQESLLIEPKLVHVMGVLKGWKYQE